MIYYILGVLAVVAVHLITFLKCYENDIEVNWPHLCISVGFSIYMIYVVEFLHDNVIGNGVGLMKIVAIYAPIGLIMPLIYKRFKYFLMNVIYTLCLDGFIIGLQFIHCGKINIMNLIFSLFGVLVGYLFSMILNEILPGLRKGLIIKKNKKRIKYLYFEAETLILAVAAIFFAVAGIEKVSGKDLEQIKGTATYVAKDKYKSIYYAEKDKYDRYDEYAKLHPDMSLEDVVWRVDANLDQEFYDVNYVNVSNSANPLIVNKFNKVADNFEPEELDTIEGSYVATPDTVEAYHKMTDDMSELNLKVYVVSSYRSIDYQNNLYNHYLRDDSKEVVDTYSSRPGYSEHHTGRALDISQVTNNLNVFEGSDEAKWVYENCYKYGFIVRYKDDQIDVTGYIFEPWHITYVGSEIAQTMHDEGIDTLEEYVVKYVDHHK